MSSPLRALLPIALVALPALAFVLWPLRRLGERSAMAAPAGDRRLELAEERRSVLRAQPRGRGAAGAGAGAGAGPSASRATSTPAARAS